MEKDIIELLKDGKPHEFIELSKALGLKKSDDALLSSTLTKLMNNYEVYCSKKGKYMLFNNSDMGRNYVKGTFRDTSNDYGFVEVEGMEDDIFIRGSKTNGAIDGDVVLVNVLKRNNRDRKCEGEVVKILVRTNKHKVGEVYHFNGKLMVSLDDKKFKKKVMLTGDKNSIERLVDGDKVQVSFENSFVRDDSICVKFVRRIGHINDPDIDILSIIAENDFDIDFPNSVIKELENVPTKVLEKELVGRKDLRNEMIFTIDGSDTKDIDDAISLDKLDNGNWKLGVHIADVSYYVHEDSAIDLEARNRGTSVYLTDRVIPMYPHQLSNGICSLNPDVDRLAISCVMEINNEGTLVNYDIFPSVIHSNMQMCYEKVNLILDDIEIPKGYEKYVDKLKEMEKLANILRKMRDRRGAIDFDTDEAKIVVDADGKAIDVVLRDRGKGEKLIEDFMIAANETVATHIYNMDLPGVYRIHDLPDSDRVIKFMMLINTMGMHIKADIKKMRPRTIQGIVNELKKYPAFKVLDSKLLSCMDKAIYDINNIGHFGIASKCYTHFTSPIRRYPDTTTHRLLRNYFFMKDGITDEKVRHFNEILPGICEHSSERERASVNCERDVDAMKMAEYMESHIGEQFEGMISGVANFGFFVELDNMIEGLVPILNLDDFYHYDNRTESLIGERKKNVFRLGDKVIVEVERASKEEKEIDFKFIKRVVVNEEKKKEKETKKKHS